MKRDQVLLRPPLWHRAMVNAGNVTVVTHTDRGVVLGNQDAAMFRRLIWRARPDPEHHRHVIVIPVYQGVSPLVAIGCGASVSPGISSALASAAQCLSQCFQHKGQLRYTMATGSRHRLTEQSSAVDLRTNARSPTIWLGDKGDWSALIVGTLVVLSFARPITFLIIIVECLAAPIENF